MKLEEDRTMDWEKGEPLCDKDQNKLVEDISKLNLNF